MTLAIQAVLAMITQFLPLIGGGTNVVLIESIVSALSGMMPFIVQEISSLYEPIKNIIAALSATPATTAAQLAILQALDKTVDDAFDAAAADTDAGK